MEDHLAHRRTAGEAGAVGLRLGPGAWNAGWMPLGGGVYDYLAVWAPWKRLAITNVPDVLVGVGIVLFTASQWQR